MTIRLTARTLDDSDARSSDGGRHARIGPRWTRWKPGGTARGEVPPLRVLAGMQGLQLPGLDSNQQPSG